MQFRTKLLLQLMNLELRKERKEKRGTPKEEHFILLLSLFFFYYYYSQIIVILWAIKPQILVALGTF